MAVHGKDQDFHLDNAGGTLTDLATYLIGSGVDFNEVIEVLEATTGGLDSKAYILGLDEASFEVEFDYGTTILAHLQGIKRGLTAVGSVSFRYGPAGSTSGMIQYTGECYITNIKVGSPIGLNTITASFQITGTLTQDTYS
jgi:hypothetical protein